MERYISQVVFNSSQLPRATSYLWGEDIFTP